jgi:outer membrane protein|tara:strand:+ start:103 stop:669 length:567 start_codon:yes stop_codon:yes gene_type:complete
MRLKYLFTMMAALILIHPIQAQDIGQAKIGVVDMNKLINESPQAQDMQSAIEEEFAPRVRDITAKESAFNTGRENLTKDNLALSNDERQNAQLQLQKDQRELEYLVKSIQEDQQNRAAIESNKILVEIINEVNKFGRDNGYDLIINEGRISQNTILNGGTLYKGASVDITNEIAKVLEKNFQDMKSGG